MIFFHFASNRNA